MIDSAGLEMVEDDSLQGRMRRLTERAVDMADVCLFLIDARAGVTALDEMFAEILRKRADHVFVAANKSEGSAADAGVLEAYSLGLGLPFVLLAAGISRLAGAFGWLRDHHRAISIVGGVALMVLGVLMVAGVWDRAMVWLQTEWISSFRPVI